MSAPTSCPHCGRQAGAYDSARWVYVDGSGTEHGWFSDAERAEMDSVRTSDADYTWRAITDAEREHMNSWYTELARSQASRTAAGPAGFWCPKCKKYQSTRTPAQLKAAREHVRNCQGKKAGASSIITNTAGEQFRVVGGSLVRVGWTIDDARKVLREKQDAKVDGILLDATSANALVQAYDGLNPENRAKLESMSLDRAMSIVWKLFSKTGSDESGMEPDDTNLGWIAEGDPNAQDEFAFEAPDFPIANEASLRVAGWDEWYSLQPGERIKIGFEEGVSEGTFVRLEPNSNPDLYGDRPVVIYTTSNGTERQFMPSGGLTFFEGPRRIGSLHQAMPNPVDLGIQVGDIFYSSWGYDQTNVDFYQVVGLTGASVKVRQIAQRTVRSGGAGGDSVVAVPDHFVGEVMTKRIQNYSDVPTFTLNSYSSAYLWDGTPKYQTGFGFGH